MMSSLRKNCILYCRVSTAKSAQEGESLDTQANILRRFAIDKGWQIVPDERVFRETFTGRKDNRPVLDEVFEYIEQNPGKVDYFVFRVIDRFTRGGSYSYDGIKKKLASYGVEMVDTYGVIQPIKNTLEPYGFEYEWSKVSPSEIAESVIANTAKAEVTNILTRMIGREIELTNQGFKVRQAADGFLNQKVLVEGKKKVIQVPDPDRAKFFIEMFNLRAAGTYTDGEIVKRINAMGYRSRRQNRWNKGHETVIGSRGGLPLTVKQLQQIIMRPIYCGVVCEKWTRHQPIRAQYLGLVSIDTFNRANRGKVFIKEDSGRLTILYDQNLRRAGRTRNNPLFPYKKLVLCPICKKPFVGSSPRGKAGNKFPTYHCSRKHKYLGVPKAVFDRNFEAFIRHIDLKRDIFESISTSFLNSYYSRKNEIVQSSIEIHKTIAELKAEQKAKSEAFVAATSTVMRVTLERQVEELEARIVSANGQSREIDISEADIDRFRQYGNYFMEHLSELLLDGRNPLQQQNLLGLIFDTFPTYEDVLNGTPKLAAMFAISEKQGLDGVLVAPPGFGWNTIETTIKKWIEVFGQIVFSKN